MALDRTPSTVYSIIVDLAESADGTTSTVRTACYVIVIPSESPAQAFLGPVTLSRTTIL